MSDATGNTISAKKLWEKIRIGMPDFLQEKHPIYVSFDKDVLREEDAVCDWDQGDMTLDEAVEKLQEIRERADKNSWYGYLRGGCALEADTGGRHLSDQ